MKKICFGFIFILICFFITGCSFTNTKINNTSSQNSLSNSSYSTNKLSVSKPIEEILYSFSTEILDKDPGRQTNIELTCNTLNGTIVKTGDTFSFCDTVGKATPDKGYKKAKIFDADGNVTLGYGGGNCQVSSTLYNAILSDSNLEIIERHPHAQRVYYVAPDKDAAVACGSVDFKFKNNNAFDVRINASTDGNYVYISLVKVS